MRKLVIIVFTIIFLLFNGTNTLANGLNYTVKSGDSLWQIANKHGVTVEYLKKVNNLGSDMIHPGKKLIISPSSSPNNNNVVQEAAANRSIYIVKAGDSLWKIANQFGMSIETLKRNNNLANDMLHIGDNLIIDNQNAYNVSRSAPPTENTINVLAKATQYLGTPYAYGGESPRGFDCSGFVKHTFAQLGYTLPRTAASQFQLGQTITKTDLIPGDLVFFRCNSGNIDHVGIYSGNNQFIHSSSSKSGGVIYSSLDQTYYSRSYAGAKRIL